MHAATASLDLFDDLPMLRWLSDETVYSIAARYSIASGIVNPSCASKILFGHRTGGFPHALPGGIGHFARVFKTTLGSPRKIIASHTVAPQLVVARSPAVREATYAAMEGAHAQTVKAKLGLLASGFGGALPLKACPVCVAEDELENGFSYWRVPPQLPSTWVCAKHAVLLDVSMAMRSGQARYNWVLPKQDDLISPWDDSRAPDRAAIQRLGKLADASRWLLTIGQQGGLDLGRLSALLWDQLSAADLAHHGRRLRPDKAAESFFEFFRPLRAISELERVAATPSIAYSQLLALLNGRANGFHPVRVASIVAWLFPSTQAFLHLYDRTRTVTAEANVPPSAAAHPRSSAERAKFLRLVHSGKSISASARRVGVEVATAQAWAAAAGIVVPRRASRIRDGARDQLVEALRRGADKTQISIDFEISASSVDRILRTEVGLREAWRAARLKAQQHSMRSAWRMALASAGGFAKVARAMKPAVYAWLYRNDGIWLRDANRVTDQRSSNNSAIDWRQRDEHLSKDVLRTAEAMRATDPARIRLLDLLAQLPALKRNLPNLRHLPRTDHALDQVLKRRRRSRESGFFSY